MSYDDYVDRSGLLETEAGQEEVAALLRKLDAQDQLCILALLTQYKHKLQTNPDGNSTSDEIKALDKRLDVLIEISKGIAEEHAEYFAVFNVQNKRNIVLNKQELLVEDIVRKLWQFESRLVVCAPTKIQVEEIFAAIRKRMDGFDRITRDITAPYHEICMDTRVTVRGFALTGHTMCGQNADYIYVCNTENIGLNIVLGTVLPILQTTPDTAITFFFEEKSGEIWEMLSTNKYYKIHDFSEPEDDGMITNPLTGKKSWL